MGEASLFPSLFFHLLCVYSTRCFFNLLSLLVPSSVADMVVSSFRPETNSVWSPAVLIGTPLTSSMSTVLFSPSLLSCVMYCLLSCVVNSAEDGTKDEVLPDGVQQLLFKETDAVIPSNTEQVHIQSCMYNIWIGPMCLLHCYCRNRRCRTVTTQSLWY